VAPPEKGVTTLGEGVSPFLEGRGGILERIQLDVEKTNGSISWRVKPYIH